MKSVIFGKYNNRNTPIHRIDPRVKFIAMIFFMIAVFLPLTKVASDATQFEKNMADCNTFIFLGCLFIAELIIMLISKIKFSTVFRSLKTMWFFIVLIFLLNILLSRASGDQVAFYMGSLSISWTAIFSSSYLVIRLLLIIMCTTILSSTTKPMDLTFAIEWFLTPLKYIKVPTHEIGMVISLALRFIPTMQEETQRIMKSQASRGVDFKNGKLKEKFRAIVSCIIPLVVTSMMKASDVADAMLARGYDPREKRTRYRMLNWRWYDTILTILLFVFLGLVITQAVIGTNYLYMIIQMF